MAVENVPALRPRWIGWIAGMVLVVVAIQVGVVLPAAVVFLLGHGAGAAGPAMIGGFLATWTTVLATLRVGRRRGWWA
jgi:hypothetical protein